MGAKVRFFDGAWYVFINHRRQRKAKKIGTGPEGKRLAEQVAKKIEAKLALGDVGIFAEREEVTLRAYAEEWLEGYVTNNLKGGTLRLYRGIMENHWLPALGDKPLGEITRQDIRRVVTDKLRHGMTTSGARGILTALQSCLRIAEEEVIAKNPLRHYSRWLLQARRDRDTAPRPRVEILTQPELKRLIDWFAREEPRWATLVLLLARTGMRIGEATALKVSDLDIEQRKIHVERTWGSPKRRGDSPFNSTKGSQDRWVDMSLQLRDALEEHIARFPSPEGWLFPTDSGLPVHPNNFRERVWKRFFTPERQVITPYRGPHMLRHTYASLLIFRGFDLLYVKEQLGHKSIRITVDTYGHLVRGESVRAVDSLDDVPADAKKRKLYASEGIIQLSLIRGGL